MYRSSECASEVTSGSAWTSYRWIPTNCTCCTLSFDLQSWLKDAANTFSGVNGSFSAGYALLTASLLAAGIGYIVAPGLTLAGVG